MRRVDDGHGRFESATHVFFSDFYPPGTWHVSKKIHPRATECLVVHVK